MLTIRGSKCHGRQCDQMSLSLPGFEPNAGHLILQKEQQRQQVLLANSRDLHVLQNPDKI